MNDLKRRLAGASDQESVPVLGHLELSILEILWQRGESAVRDIVELLNKGGDPPRAYTTAMTTLDRLYKKGVLSRYKADRAFVYSPILTKEQFETRRAQSLISGLLAESSVSNNLLISCLVDAVDRHEPGMLEEFGFGKVHVAADIGDCPEIAGAELAATLHILAEGDPDIPGVLDGVPDRLEA